MFKKKRDCDRSHWFVVEGKLILETPTENAQELAQQVISVLRKEIRNEIYESICDFKPLENRKQIMKMAGSMDNALLAVQAMCADIALNGNVTKAVGNDEF